MNALSGPVEPSESWRMEEFSRAYGHVVAAAAACEATRPTVDRDSVDLMLKRKTEGTHIRSPQLDIQIKATAADCVGSTDVTFALRMKNYDELRATNLLVPRILVIVVIPPDVSDWIEHDETRLALKRCGYWLSLYGRPERPNTTSVNINIPRGQAFTVQALDEMFRRLAEGERP